MSSRHRRAGVLALVLAGAVTVTGCGAGFDPDTDLVIGNGGAAGAGEEVLARAFILVTAPDSDTVALAGTLLNQTDAPDVLTQVQVSPGVTGDAAAGADLLSAAPALTVSPGQVVQLRPVQRPSITIPDAADYVPGSIARVDLVFATAGRRVMQVPVVTRQQYYYGSVPVGDAATGNTPTGNTLTGNALTGNGAGGT